MRGREGITNVMLMSKNQAVPVVKCRTNWVSPFQTMYATIFITLLSCWDKIWLHFTLKKLT